MNELREYPILAKDIIFKNASSVRQYLTVEYKAMLLDMGVEFSEMCDDYLFSIESKMELYEAFEESGRLS